MGHSQIEDINHILFVSSTLIKTEIRLQKQQQKFVQLW